MTDSPKSRNGEGYIRALEELLARVVDGAKCIEEGTYTVERAWHMATAQATRIGEPRYILFPSETGTTPFTEAAADPSKPVSAVCALEGCQQFAPSAIGGTPQQKQFERVLDEIEDFLEDQQDVRDGSDGQMLPNAAMSLLTDLRWWRPRPARGGSDAEIATAPSSIGASLPANAKAIHGKAIAFPIKLRTDDDSDPSIEWFEDAHGDCVDPYTVMLAINAAYCSPSAIGESKALDLLRNLRSTMINHGYPSFGIGAEVDDFLRSIDRNPNSQEDK